MKFKNVIKVIRYFFVNAMRIKEWFIYVYVLKVVINAAQPFLAMLIPKLLIDELLGAQRIDRLIIISISMLFLEFLLNVLSVILTEIIQKGAYDDIHRHLEANLGFRIMRMRYEDLEKKEILDKIEKARLGLSSEYSGGIQGICGAFSILFAGVITLVGTIGIVLKIVPLLVIGIIILVLMNGFLTYKKNRIQVTDFKIISQIERGINYLYMTLSDQRYGKEVRLFKANNIILGKIREYDNKFFSVLKRQEKHNFSCNKYIQVNLALILGIIYFYAGYYAIKGSISLGELTMAVMAAKTLSDTLNCVISQVLDVEKRASYACEFVDFMFETDVCEKFIGINKNVIPKPVIEFANVSFRYPDRKNYALQNVSFKIDYGERICLVGVNGAGKSTIVKLLCRLYEVTEGEILINGVNINSYNREEYLNTISSVFQDYKLFGFSIKENLMIDIDDKNKENKLNQILKSLGLYNKVLSYEKGKDMALFHNYEENGFEPSGGEQQKLAVARALLKEAPIIIFDEPTSALDSISEFQMYKDISQTIVKDTVIFISHRMSSCQFCDRIIVLQEGKIIESGTHRSLLERNGTYAKMYIKQAQYYV